MPEPLQWHIGDVVRKLRERQEFKNQEALGLEAARLDHGTPIDKGTVGRLEAYGEARSSPDTIRRIARALGVGVRDLYALVPISPTAEALVTDEQLRERDLLWSRLDRQGRETILIGLRRIAETTVPAAADPSPRPLPQPVRRPKGARTHRGTKRA